MQEPPSSGELLALKLASIVNVTLGQRPATLLQLLRRHTKSSALRELKQLRSRGVSQLILPEKPQAPSTRLARVRRAACSCLKPKGPGSNDCSLGERVVNVATSLPFVAVGISTMRRRETSEGRQFGAWLVAIGLSAAAYHAAEGPLRVNLRKLDYWTITAATGQMARAARLSGAGRGGRAGARPDARSRCLAVALAALAPLQPTLVSMVNIAATEAEFARRTLSSPAAPHSAAAGAPPCGSAGLPCACAGSAAARRMALRRAHRRHLALGGLGLVCFAGEDVARERLGWRWAHAVWHCLACYGVAGVNALLADRELAVA